MTENLFSKINKLYFLLTFFKNNEEDCVFSAGGNVLISRLQWGVMKGMEVDPGELSCTVLFH